MTGRVAICLLLSIPLNTPRELIAIGRHSNVSYITLDLRVMTAMILDDP